MSNKHHIKTLVIWAGGFVLIGIIIFILLRQISCNDDLGFWVGTFGAYASLYGLIVMLVQFQSVRTTTEETKKKIDGISLVSEWSKATELIRSAETDIERGDMSIAGFKLRRVKDIVIQSKMGLVEDKECDKSIKLLNSDISLLNQYLLSDPLNRHIDKQDMLDGLEHISDILSRMINKNINSL